MLKSNWFFMPNKGQQLIPQPSALLVYQRFFHLFLRIEKETNR